MQKEHKVLQKLLQECFLPKGGGVDQLSLEHKVFLHFFVKFEKVNLPRYIFHHMFWALRESQDRGRKFIPYGRLLLEIFYQGGILKALKITGLVFDDQLGTMVGKYINAFTLKNMYLVEEAKKLSTNLKESTIVYDLMEDFPPISKEDNPKVLAAYVTNHYEKNGEIINYSSILDTMAGTPLRIASKKRKSKKSTSEDVETEAFEPKPKKAKKEKVVAQVNIVVAALPTIQKEVEDLEPVKVLDKRTRGGKAVVGSSGAIPAQPKIQKKKKNVRKMKVSEYVLQEDAEIEASTDLVTRMERNKKVVADASLLNKAFVIASEIGVPVVSLLKESTTADAQKVVELAEEIQDLVTEESGELLKEVHWEEVGISEADASEATRGNSSSHIISDDITELDTSSPSSSSDKTSTSSPTTKNQRKPTEFVPVYPSILRSIGEMAQMRIDVCERLHVNHPFQPPFIQPLQTIPADAKFESEHVEPDSDIPVTTTSSQPKPTTQTSDPSVLEELANHYKGESPKFKPNSETASAIVSDISVSKSPQQQQSNS